MSDDPASIEAWQEEEKGDLVARLRVINHHTKKLAENEGLHYVHREAFTRCENLTWEAANEIERLRKRLLAEENAYDIMRRENEHLQTDRNNLALEIERLRKRLRQENATLTAERDEARREVCGLLVACHTDPDDEKPDPNLKHVHAEIRGWDCFKEASND